MPQGLGLGLDTAPPKLRTFLDRLTEDIAASLGDDLVAVILHGSLATKSFYPPKSDIDILVIAEDLSELQSHALYRLFERHHAARPYVGGLEASAIRRADARAPVHPVPFLVHFSEATTGPIPHPDGRLPTDPDLAAHLTVARRRGVSLLGSPPAAIIGKVPRADYLAAVHTDIEWILEGENILTTPVYGVLNLCRWAMMEASSEPIVPSKEEAALWALAHLPEPHRAIVGRALAAYRASERPADAAARRIAGGPWDRDALLGLCDALRATLDP